MNNVLELKGQFQSHAHLPGGSLPTLPQGANKHPVTIEHLQTLKSQLENILLEWQKNDLINGALVSVHCIDIIAKTNRLGCLLKEKGCSINENIRGIKFEEENGKQKHVFTYFLSIASLNESIRNLNIAIGVMYENYKEGITKKIIEKINKFDVDFKGITYNQFLQIIKDCYYVNYFNIDKDRNKFDVDTIVSLYKTGNSINFILNKLGINILKDRMLDENTLRLTNKELEILCEKAPYLIAMKTTDISQLSEETIYENQSKSHFIEKPKEEPIIGVIDTLFDKRAYFNEWVEYVEDIPEGIVPMEDDYFHGTAVSSIIVDGSSLNPKYDDGCGKFRVKHYGVAVGNRFSSFSILKIIRKAVRDNPDIKVWNLSLGSIREINDNFISIEGAELDKIQSEYDVVFVVAGTNKPKYISSKMKIGAPADSINSIVVNSVNKYGEPASYHRVGPVLSFFYKPDVSYYGGDKNSKINVFSVNGDCAVMGTSFAAPWIARKMAYLIQVLGFSREIAKALIIDSAAGWNRKDNAMCNIGYGVVPINIKDIVSSKNDEIKMLFTGATTEYETSVSNIPIPVDENGEYPYDVRATLCYYPKCIRNQGVDYTETEIDFQFGRVANDKGELKAFNGNTQGDKDDLTRENIARLHFRKWDNTKHIGMFIPKDVRSKKSYEGHVCGIKMTVKERMSTEHTTIPFGIVITIRELTGKNRISEFIKKCFIKGWFVNQINIENRIEVINKTNEEIIFD